MINPRHCEEALANVAVHVAIKMLLGSMYLLQNY